MLFFRCLFEKNHLTLAYYAKKLLPYVNHYYLTEEWKRCISTTQIYEKVAIFFAKWCQPDEYIPSWYISKQLDTIAEEVIERMKTVNSIHPIFSTSQEKLSLRTHNINNNHNFQSSMWNDHDTKQILDLLCKILYEEQFYICYEHEDSLLINRVSCFVITHANIT